MPDVVDEDGKGAEIGIAAERVADRILQHFAIMKPGEILVCELERNLGREAETKMRSAIGAAASNLGIKVLVLPYGMKAARCERKGFLDGNSVR